MKNIIIILQARYSSTRLPGKVLKNIVDKPLLWYVIKRLEHVKTPVSIIIATGPLDKNQLIVDFAKKYNFNYFIGDEDNVLDRYYQTAKKFKGDIIVRITSDCPLIDSQIIDKMLENFLISNFDYYSNVRPPTFPNGYDTEIFSFKALEIAWHEAKLPSEKEHVTPYIWKNENNQFNIGHFKNDIDLSDYRLTVDTPEDFELLKIIIEHFYDNWNNFQMNDVIHYLKENPDLLKINNQFIRDEGYAKSLEEDKYFFTSDKK